MTTPADWYPDPQDSASLRYWDGMAWTEHRAPARPPTFAGPPADSQPQGAHRAPDPESMTPPTAVPTPAQPYDTHPRTSYEAPYSEGAPTDSAPGSTAYDVRPSESTTHEPASSEPAPSEPLTFEPQPSYGGAPQSYDSAAFAPHPEPSGRRPGGEPNKKVVFGIIGGSVAILVAIVVVLVLLVIRQIDATVTASPATSSSPTATPSETTSETPPESTEAQAPLPPPPGAEGSDGDYTFSIASTETGDTITSTVSESVETTADGMYYVVHLNVANTGATPLTFVATFQALSAAGQTFPLDDEATAFLDGTVATIDPGAQVETALVYDVPVGTEPDSIMLRADPSTAGVELPLR